MSQGAKQEAKKKERGACGTTDSHVVPHRSTEVACSGLTSQIGRDTVRFTEYGRRRPSPRSNRAKNGPRWNWRVARSRAIQFIARAANMSIESRSKPAPCCGLSWLKTAVGARLALPGNIYPGQGGRAAWEPSVRARDPPAPRPAQRSSRRADHKRYAQRWQRSKGAARS